MDRNGAVLATSVPVMSAFVNPHLLIDPQEAARKIVTALPDLKYDDVREKLEGDRTFVWIKRGLSPREHDRVNRLGIPGLEFQAEERRKINIPAYAAGGLVTVAFIAQLWFVLQKFELGKTAFAPLAEKHVDDVRNVGNTLFSTHNLPFQVIGVLILVATIGVVVLSKRELK